MQKNDTSFRKSTAGLGNPPQALISTNTYFSKGIRKGRTFLHCRVGEGKLEPGLPMFISQPAAFSVHDTGVLGLRGPDKQGFRHSWRKEVGEGDNMEEGEHPFPLKKGRHEDL